MKKRFILIPFILILATILILFLSGNKIDNPDQQSPKVLSMTASVEIPERMIFAGEAYTFDRYDMHERLDRELNSFTYFHSTTLLLIKRANRIFPIIEPILKQYGIPDDIKYLAVIESSLDPRAVSPAGASGLWQFMPATATQFGIEVTAEVDERYSIEKSTIAASRYLKDAYRKYGSWSAAALSYNGGQGRITQELRNQQTNESLDLWLVDETTRYYYRMLAIKLVFENPPQYGFIIRPHQLYKPMVFKDVEVSTAIPDLVNFAKQYGLTYAQLKDFNSWLRSTKLTVRSPKSYTIKIPTRESLFYKRGQKAIVHNPRWVTQ
ncbi:MAG: transglycosylase SLT domain-containing protein [Candidatus Saccharimonadaceae bacterium]